MGERTVAQEALRRRIRVERDVLADKLFGSIDGFLNLLGTLSMVWNIVQPSLNGMASGGRLDGRRQGLAATPPCRSMGNQARHRGPHQLRAFPGTATGMAVGVDMQPGADRLISIRHLLDD